MEFRSFANKLIDKLPITLQRIIHMIMIEARFAFFKTKWAHRTVDIPNPANIYWIPTERIAYHTNYVGNRTPETVPLEDRSFPNSEKIRGKVLSGNWDVTNYKFTDLDAYRAFKERIEKGAEWRDTDFYKNILTRIESGQYVWGLKNIADLDKRCEYFDWLYEKIKNEGYKINRSIHNKNTTFDEITVNIGRNGEYLFQDGRHRLSIAKILGIKYVPVMVFVRHKKWMEFRKFIIFYAQSSTLGGKLYQPIVHPDLSDIPYDLQSHDYHHLMAAIARHLEKKSGIMLDIGANLGYFCHKFEDLGYQCYAVEIDIATYQILERIRIAENKKFEAINKSIFEVDIIKKMEFDVVLALNIFHHFLKRKTTYLQLIDLLENLKTTELFFEPHLYSENQMRNAYVNFTETEFVDFLFRHTSFTKSEIIYTAENGRHVFKLSK